MNDESNALQPADKIPRWDIGEYGQCTLNRKNGRFVEFLDYKAALAQIESLTRSKENALKTEALQSGVIAGLQMRNVALERENKTLRAELDAAKVDAERWRWLTSGGHGYEVIHNKVEGQWPIYIDSWDLDKIADTDIANIAAIDTARSRGDTGEKIG